MRIFANIPKLCAILAIPLCWVGCGPGQEKTNLFETDGFYNGMVYHVVYHDTLRRDLALPIDSVVWAYAASMSIADTNSILSRVNRNDTNVILSEILIRAIRNQKRMDSITGGLLPMNTGLLKQRWGLYGKKLKPGWREPSQPELDSLLAMMKQEQVSLFVRDFTPREVGQEQRGMDQKFWLENLRIHRNAPIDLDAISRGLLADLIAEYLELEDINNYSVQVDKVIRTSGKMKDKPWKIGFERPELSEMINYESTIELTDLSVSTSGFTRKAISTPTGDHLPMIDPTNGHPVAFSFITYSVIAEDASTADMLSNVLCILGKEKALAFAKAHSFEIYIIEKTPEDEFLISSTLSPSRNPQNKK